MSETKRPLKVFLSYAHADCEAVRGLYARLKREGVDVWLDKEKLLPGADWELEIRKAVREADVVVVCLSKQFNQAGFRQKEVRIALNEADMKPEGEIFIIPARLEECETLESLRKWNWVDLFEADGYERLASVLKSQADKFGATVQVRRSKKPKATVLPQKDKNASEVLASSGGVSMGGGASGSVIVTGSGNVINLNQAPSIQADSKEIEIVETGAGRYTTKIRLQTQNLENVFALLQNRLQGVSQKPQVRVKTRDNYPDGIARKVTYSETLTWPNRVGNKIVVKCDYHIMVYPGKTNITAEEIIEMHQFEAITIIGWETQTVLLEIEYLPTWDEMMKKIIIELYDLFGKYDKAVS
jgi:hypothetical protein